MAKKEISSDTLPPEIAQAAQAQGIPDYQDPPRRAPRPRVPMVDDDPILNIDDAQIAAGGLPPFGASSEPDPALTEAATEVDPISRLASAIEALQRRGASAAPLPDTVMERLVAAMEKVASGQQAGTVAAAEALRKASDPSNPVAPGTSDFNPRGERDFPRPRLKCQMFLPWEAEWESLTREEIELLNLLEPGEFIIRRNDESKCVMTVGVRQNLNGKYDRLLMNAEVALNNDHHWMMPPLRNILRQILNQRPGTRAAASAVRTKEEEVELVEKYGPDFEKALAKAS